MTCTFEKYFARPVQLFKGSIAVVEIDEGFDIHGSGDQVFVNLDEEPASAREGDRVRVAYSGGVMETYPLQINQEHIQLLERVEDQTESLMKPPKDSSAEMDWERRISEAILQRNQGRYTGEECAGEGHKLLDMEEQDGK